jgi:hypothetical protein
MPSKDITDYGSVSTAGGDMTTALLAMLNDPHGNASGAGGDYGHARVPAGKFVWSGTPINMANVGIEFTDPWHTIITCATPFLNLANITQLYVGGVSLFGSTDPIQIGTATDNGGRMRILENIELHGYSGTGIKITGSDTPYMRFSNITYDGAANSKGFSTAGVTDNSVFEGFEFRSYKVGAQMDGHTQRTKCRDWNFMHVGETSANPRTDVHIIPSTNNINCGIGLTFQGMWHGNEGRAVDDNFFVFADAASGLPNLGATSAGYLYGVVIEDIGAFWPLSAQPYINAKMHGDHLQANDFGDKARRYLAAEAYGAAPMVQLPSGEVLAATNRIHQWLDIYTETGAVIDSFPVDFEDGPPDPTNPRRNVHDAWYNAVGSALNLIAPRV